MAYQEVRYTVEDGIALLTLDRPERRNALRLLMMNEIVDALDCADRDPAVRAVVVTGNGPTFCVGAELSGPDALRDGVDDDHVGHTPDGYREPAGRITERIYAMRVPVIGAINGDAVGGGATILAAMDMRIASKQARFGFVFSRRGVSPEGASTWFLPRLVGNGWAADWLLTGRVFPASEALTAGFLSRTLSTDEVLPAAIEYARTFTTVTSPQSVALTRRLLGYGWTVDAPADSAREESRVYAGLVESPDAKEGVLSFIERRAPIFTSTGIDAY